MHKEAKWLGDNLILTLWGHVDIQEIMEFNNYLYGIPNFEDMQYQLIDFTHVTSFRATDSEVELVTALERSASRWNKKLKMAFVNDNPEIEGFIRKYEEGLAGSGWKIGCFTNIETAQSWCAA